MLQWLPDSLHVSKTRPELPPTTTEHEVKVGTELCQVHMINSLTEEQTTLACLGEEVNAVGDCVHGDGVSSDEEASKVHSGQVVQLGVQTGQLPDIVADHVK